MKIFLSFFVFLLDYPLRQEYISIVLNGWLSFSDDLNLSGGIQMTYSYSFYWRNNHGRVFKHRRPFKTFESAKKALLELQKRNAEAGNAVVAWAIVKNELNKLEEASGRVF